VLGLQAHTTTSGLPSVFQNLLYKSALHPIGVVSGPSPMYSEQVHFYWLALFIYFWQYWSLNSVCCEAGALPLEPCPAIIGFKYLVSA
jgi:hypothetical protein